MIINKQFEVNVWIYDLKTGMKYDKSDIDVVLMNDETMEALSDITTDMKKLVRTGKAKE